MKFFIVLALVATVAVAVPVDPKDAETTVYENNNIGVGNYNYEVQTNDGKSVSESGVLKNVGSEQEALEVRGSFSYIGKDGVTYTVTYYADETGFHPSGSHLPA